ncbi:hypothetical protein DRQ16_00090 [bacterium]|nr:MAG: hypothetical protein DRQ16_00090 [bacterium]
MFRKRLFITFTFTFGIFLFIFSLIFLREEIRLVHTRMKEKGEKILEGLLHPARFFLLTGDSSVVEVGKEYMEDPDVLSIAIFDSHRKPVLLLGDIIPVKKDDFLSLRLMARRERGYLFMMPITLPVGGLFEEKHERISGYLGVFISDAPFRKAIVTFAGEVVFFLLFFAGLGFVISHYLSRRLTENIDALLKGVEEIEKGRFEKKIEIRGEPELERLAQSINQMAESLKKRIDEIERLNAELREKSEKLDEAYRKVVISERAKSEFFESVSHEFRTPLQVIGGYTELLLKEKLSKKAREKLERIRKSVERLSELIESVLSLKTRSPEDYKEVDLKEIVKKVVLSMDEKLGKRKINVEVEVGETPSIRAVPEELERAFEAILMNAISSGAETIKIYGGRKNREVEIDIEDGGGKESLGLSIARMIVEAHGGRFEIEGDKIKIGFEV